MEAANLAVYNYYDDDEDYTKIDEAGLEAALELHKQLRKESNPFENRKEFDEDWRERLGYEGDTYSVGLP